MKRLAFLFIATPCFAQQAPDPALNACQQILATANTQTIQVAIQLQSVIKQLEDAKAELAKLKQNPKE
jgi:hypothetical protein